MSRLTVYDSKLHGEINLPVSKSEAHRAVICSSLARNSIDAIDLGLETTLPDDILITRKAMKDLLSDIHMIFCGESGSTLRFLIPIAAALGKNVIFTGAGRLPLRPLKEYAQSFSDNGAILKFPENDSQYLPLEVKGRLRPGIYKLPGNVSSQYVSGLLMSLPLLNAESRIIITSGLESSGYVDMTVEVMSEFGVKVTRSGNDFIIEGEQAYKDIDYTCLLYTSPSPRD